MGSHTLRIDIEEWPRIQPLHITGYTFHSVQVIVVSVTRDGRTGLGEAAGAYYKKENAASMAAQLEALRPVIEEGVSREVLQTLLPAGGARNALDCALWDLEAKLAGCAVWQLAGLSEPRPLLTTLTCGAEEPEQMARTALGFHEARALKLKLTGEPVDADRIRAVRSARPDVWLSVDANQGFTRPFLERLMPVLVECEVKLIEQPFAIGQEEQLKGLRSPIPIAADESLQELRDIAKLAGAFNMGNIKLDKCGGLTHGLQMVRALREAGMDAMVGCMGGTSLAMAPAFVLGQSCDVVDLDGPVFLRKDRPKGASYAGGMIVCPRELWGAA